MTVPAASANVRGAAECHVELGRCRVGRRVGAVPESRRGRRHVDEPRRSRHGGAVHGELGHDAFADGLYDVRVITTDNAGNAFTSATTNVRVDNTSPTGAITAPVSSART